MCSQPSPPPPFYSWRMFKCLMTTLTFNPFTLFISTTCSVLITHSNDWYRGPTDLVQHSVYRGRSHRRKGAASHTHMIDMGFGYIARLSPWGGRREVFHLFKWRLRAFVAPRRRGERESAPCVLFPAITKNSSFAETVQASVYTVYSITGIDCTVYMYAVQYCIDELPTNDLIFT